MRRSQVASVAAQAKNGHYPIDSRLQAVFQAGRVCDVFNLASLWPVLWTLQAIRNGEFSKGEPEARFFCMPLAAHSASVLCPRRTASSAPLLTSCATSRVLAPGKAHPEEAEFRWLAAIR